MQKTPTFHLLTKTHIPKIAKLGQQLNPKLSIQQIEAYLEEMFQYPTYHCFGLYLDEELIGISSGWITVRFYSGKQLEVDNVVIDEVHQSKGLGQQFFQHIEAWAVEHDCQTVELNTYVQNAPSHKFYFRQGYAILGFHFLKEL